MKISYGSIVGLLIAIIALGLAPAVTKHRIS